MHRDCFDHREHKSIPEGPHALQFGYRLVQVRGGCSFSLEEGRRLHGNLDVLSQEGRETQGPGARSESISPFGRPDLRKPPSARFKQAHN